MAGNDQRSRTELVASSSTVDIVSIPWRFFGVKYDQLDQLFLPMLSSAQQANDILGVCARGPGSGASCGRTLRGELLRDGELSRQFGPGPSMRQTLT